MSGTGLPEVLHNYQAEVEQMGMRDTDESEKEFFREYYTLFNVTAADLQRDYSPEDVRLLCLCTKMRVKMTKLNCVWNAKKRLMSKGRLANRSERYINAMLVKAVTNKMVEPYTDEEVVAYNIIKKSELKTLNNIRLDR